MSHQTSIEAPYVLTALPKSLDTDTGRTFASTVRTYKSTRWRRRPEIAMAIDGEGISIYDVRNSRLTASYALPPQTRFSCPPTSIYRRYAREKRTQRHTYVAISESETSATQILCFADEHSSSNTNLNSEHQTKHAFTPRNAKSPVVSLIAVASGDVKLSDWKLSLVIVHADGSLECVDTLLKKSLWTANVSDLSAPEQSGSQPLQVSFAKLSDFNSARAGLLHSRPDASALIESLLGGEKVASQHSLLVLVTTSKVSGDSADRHLRCLVLPNISSSAPLSALRRPQQILDLAIPRASHNKGPAKFDLHESSGTLYELAPHQLTAWDLSPILPKVISTIPSMKEDFSSCSVLTPSLVAVCTITSCKILDVTYQCLQSGQRTVESSKNRRSLATPAALQLVDCFTELGLLVAVQGNQLLAFPTAVRTSFRRGSNLQRSLLADAYCKGLGDMPNSRASRDGSRVDSKDGEWSKWVATVDSLADEGNVGQLEKFLAREMHIQRHKAVPSATGDLESGASAPLAEPQVDADADDYESRIWQLPKDNSQLIGRTKKRKALHCLRKIFVLDSESGSGSELNVALYAQEILTWLAMTGFLNAKSIEEAFREDDEQGTVTIAKGALARAFVALDPTLGVVHDFLALPVHVDPEEIVFALQAVIQSLDSPPPADVSQKLLTTGPNASEMKENNENEAEAEVNEESRAAEADLAFALVSLNDGIAVRSEVLSVMFLRLINFPAARIVQLFRKQLSSKELIFLITLLRIELADGGWTVRYQDEPDDIGPTEGFSNRSLSVIAKLLNMAVDAVGTSGWLVGLSGGDTGMSTDDMLLVLRAETTAALEGCYEAEILKSQLNDFEKYTRALENTVRRGKKRKFEQHSEQMDSESGLLPLGCKVDTIETTSVSKGGKVREKSVHAIRHEMSMKVGRYTIDRIRV